MARTNTKTPRHRARRDGRRNLDEAVRIATQIAQALEAAHERGVVHHDLKPANVKLRPDGTVKVLDFGLAKAMEPPGAAGANVSNSPTMSMEATQRGVLLGTAGYMSPEQACGKPVDKRTDIWVLGCVFNEMLTGQQAFPGDNGSGALRDAVDQGRSVHELHHQGRRPVGPFHRAIDLAHSADADQRGDLVRAQASPGRKGHVKSEVRAILPQGPRRLTVGCLQAKWLRRTHCTH